MRHKKIILLVVLLFLSSCGGGGECNFDFASITNGANLATATKYWRCAESDGIPFDLLLLDNGTGYGSLYSLTLDAFTWQESGCGEASIQSADGDFFVDNINGSYDSGAITFSMSNDSGQTETCSCYLIDAY